jgi:hypothetical protein
MASNIDTVELRVTLGHTGDGMLYLRFPPEYSKEIRDLLDEQDVSHGEIVELSAGPELVIEAVRVLDVPGGLAALAYIIRTIVHRNDGKNFKLERDGLSVSATNYSEQAVERLLAKRAAEQKEQDAQWEDLRNQQPKSGED